MPVYEFQCQACGLRFEQAVKVANREKPSPCPNCQQAAPRSMPSQVSGVFHQTATGPGPQNTGVSEFDAHVDRVIGDHAQQGWKVAEQRVGVKRKVLARHPGAKGLDLSRQLDGSYQILSPEARGVMERSLEITHLAMEARKKKPPEDSAS